MAADRDILLRRIAALLIPLPLFYASAAIGRLFALQASGLETMWLGNAAVLGVMRLQRDRAGAQAIAAGGFAAGLALHLGRGEMLPVSLAFAAANLAEWLVAFALLSRLGVRSGFDRARDVAAFALACAAGTACSASIGALAVTLLNQGSYGSAWHHWLRAALLAQLLLTPMILLAGEEVRRGWRPPSAWQIAEAVTLLAGATAVGVFCFFSRLPYLFMVSPAMLIVAIRLRASGAVAATALVALVALVAQATGHGPIVGRLHDPADSLLVLQLFLATSFLSSLPVAALLAERDARAAEARLMGERLRAVVESVGEIIFQTDMRGRWTYLNPAWERLTGHAIADSLGESSIHLVHREDRAALLDRVEPVFLGALASAHRVVRISTRNGMRWMELLLQPLHDAAGAVIGGTGTLRDIDDRKRLEEHVTDAKRRAERRAREAITLAETDELTGLANRRAFLRQLDRELAAAKAYAHPLAVAMFDVDHFKRINDRHGHAAGDRVLRQLAKRANAVVRGGDLVGRLGGEEFGVIMPGATALDAAVVAERLREAMERVRLDEHELPPFTVSIGIAMCDEQADGAALLASADQALYRAKNGGRNQVRLAA